MLPFGANVRPVEYVQADGSQWVDTGIAAGPTIRLEVDLLVEDWTVDTFSLCGAGSMPRLVFGKGYSGVITGTGNSAKFYVGLGAQNNPTSTYLRNLEGERHVYFVDAVAKTGGFDNTSFAMSTAGEIGIGNSIALLAQRNGAASVRGLMAARLYAARLYDGGVLVRDLAPVRVGSAGALYDRASGSLFHSATATPLVAGPDK